MRSDARKRLQQKPLPPIGIRRRHNSEDWDAACNGLCDDPLMVTAGNWRDVYEVALGHACLFHPKGVL